VVVWQLCDQLGDARPQLVREVRCRGPDERVDVVEGRLSHAPKPNAAAPAARLGSVLGVRRPSAVELMLLTTVLLWALNLSVTKYILSNGFLPLPYATVRYGLAAAIFIGLTLYVDRTLRVERRHVPIMLLAAGLLFVNQLCFVFAIDATTASTIGLLLGAIPIFAALFGLALGTERATGRFWLAAFVSALGVALVAAGSGGELSSGLVGILLGLATAATWAAYSVAAAPLMRTYSPSRMSAIVIPTTWIGLAICGIPQDADQDWDVGWEIWVLMVFATIGPLVVTNVLWFRAVHRIGANRATLAANLEPFVAAVLAVILLSEPLGLFQIMGGVLIALGILVVRRRATAPQPA
jgi:drug/metabolite transporter (DMT)-like permease